MITNRNRWSFDEEQVLLNAVIEYSHDGRGGLITAMAEASKSLSRSEKACLMHWHYMRGSLSYQKKQPTKKQLKSQLEKYGIQIHGSVVTLSPKEGIKIVIK